MGYGGGEGGESIVGDGCNLALDIPLSHTICDHYSGSNNYKNLKSRNNTCICRIFVAPSETFPLYCLSIEYTGWFLDALAFPHYKLSVREDVKYYFADFVRKKSGVF